MNRTGWIVLLIALLALMGRAHVAAGQSASGVTITAPAKGTVVPAGQDLLITAKASTTEGIIRKVEFFAGSDKLGEDADTPYQFTWKNVPAGTHALIAIATTSTGKTYTSWSVRLTVQGSDAAALSEPSTTPESTVSIPEKTATSDTSVILLPETLEAEKATVGPVVKKGPSHIQCPFRYGDDGVVEWTITRPFASSARVVFHYANGTEYGRTAAIWVNDSMAGSIALPPTGSWDSWRIASLNVMLVAGDNKIRVRDIESADAAKEFAKSEIIIDNDDKGVVIAGDWRSSGPHGCYGIDYLYDNRKVPGFKSVRYVPVLQPSQYEVFVRWTIEGGSRASNAPIDIIHDAGVTTVRVDQRSNPSTWFSLGTFDLDGVDDSVVIRNDDADAYVIADAVRFVSTGKSLHTGIRFDKIAVTAGPDPNRQARTEAGVSITCPVPETTAAAKTHLLLTADALADGEDIKSVVFITPDLKIAEDTAAPYRVLWKDLPAGQHAITAVATTSSGKTYVSEAVSITVTPPPGAESTVAQNDAAQREPSRADDAPLSSQQIGATTLPPVTYELTQAARGTRVKLGRDSNGNSYAFLSGSSDFYVEWTVQQPQAGSATLDLHYANGSDTERPAAVTVNGVLVSTVALPPTGSPTTWKVLSVSVPLTSGENRIRIAGNGAAAGTQTTNEVIIDDADDAFVSLVGPWPEAKATNGYHGKGYLKDQGSPKGGSVRYAPKLAPGLYEVSMRWSSADNRADQVPVDIIHDGGTATVKVNQRSNGGQWNPLGTFSFGGKSNAVVIRTEGTTGIVIADAVRFVRKSSASGPFNLCKLVVTSTVAAGLAQDKSNQPNPAVSPKTAVPAKPQTPVASSAEPMSDRVKTDPLGSAVATKSAPQRTGALSGTIGLPPDSSVNLSTEGTLDWIHWGTKSAFEYNRKAHTKQQISHFAAVGSPVVARVASGLMPISWNNGLPDRTVTSATSGVAVAGTGNGFKITVPAGTGPQTLKLYLGVRNARGRLDASLSDNSVAAHTNTLGNGQFVYTIDYAAASEGQTLTLTWTVLMGSANGDITLQAATLSTPGDVASAQ